MTPTSLQSSAVIDQSPTPKATAAEAAAAISATAATAAVVPATTAATAATRATAETREHGPGQTVPATRSWEAEAAIPQGSPAEANQ